MAGKIPQTFIDDLLDRVDIVDVVGSRVDLRKSGKNHSARCPFHDEKTPSFTVSQDKQFYYCFGCGAGGNIFSFLMKNDGLAFPEAARSLARRYGIDIPRRSLTPEQKKRMGERESLLKINRQAMDFFSRALRRGTSGQTV